MSIPTNTREVDPHPENIANDGLESLSDRDIQDPQNWNKEPLEEVLDCIHHVIHNRAMAQPDKEAVCSSEESLSYHQLDLYSSSFAQFLIEQGVKTGDFIPLLFDKSIWNVVATLSVLKAGAAFVPLDPLAPVTRLHTLASNIEAKIILVSRQHSLTLSTLADTVISVDGAMIRQLPHQNDHLPNVTYTDLAYLIWTSGSTGEPKGTIIEHGAYCTGAKYHGSAMLMLQESRVLQFASHTFDASLVEILTTLMIGGTVCIPNEEERLNSLAATMQTLQVNWAVLTPSFVGLIDPADFPGLKTLVMAGESMSQSHLEKWSHINLVNGYGPSESSVAASVQSHVTLETEPNNIGFPTGAHLWVVDPDDHQRLVSIGCVGELLIQGPTLARGYFNQPEKTAQAFIPAPKFSKETGRKWRAYKTGDLVRQNFDGTLTFIGRKDNQVKVHGQRVELGEIEHHLVAESSIKHGLVLLPKFGPMSSRLVAVISLSDTLLKVSTPTTLVLIPDQAQMSDQTRERLSSLLPPYMVPSLVLVVETLPFLPSGKLDRKTAMQWAESMDEDSYRAVINTIKPIESIAVTTNSGMELQNKLRSVWGHVLNLDYDQVDLNRSFMGLGGDSISAIQVKGQCSKFKISLTVQEILRSKSIMQLSHCAKTPESLSHHEEIIGQYFNLSPIQQLFFQLPGQGHGHFNQSFFLRVVNEIHEDNLRFALNTIIERHSMLRARFTRRNDNVQWQQQITDDVSGSYRLRTHQILQPKGAYEPIADSQTCLDTTKGPVFAADLFRVEGGCQLLFLVGHHLVIDLVSWRVILEDLEELLSNSPDYSNEKPASFQTWCQMQAEQCQKLPIDTLLPAEHVPPGDASYWGMLNKKNTYGSVDCKGFEVDQVTTAKLLTQCHGALRTEPIDILLSSLIHSFALTFGDRDVPAIYNEAHGREASGMPIDISRTVGWFTVMYPVHVGESTSKDLLDTVRHVKDYRRRVVDNGRPYFASRHLTKESNEHFGDNWPLEITFNYLGQYQQLEREGALLVPADAMAGETRGAGGISDVGFLTPRFGLFEISAVIVQGKLRFSFTFNREMEHQDKILVWIQSCQRIIGSMITVLMEMEKEVTPGDFPLLSLTYDDVKTKVPAKLKQIGVSKFDDVEDIYPCSSMQEGLLISQTKSSAFYAVRVISELKSSLGPVDANRLSQAWQQVVDRHSALRTVFIPSSGVETGLFDQVVLKNHTPEIIYMDCSSTSYAVRKLSTEATAMAEGSPPHTFAICKTSDGKVICGLNISHAIMDGASMSIIFRDLALAYEGLLATEPRPLYSDYISFLRTQSIEESLDYWKNYLQNVEPCIFPILNDGVLASKELKSLRLDFSNFEHSKLRDFCNTKGWTISNILHMAWALTLRCYTSSNDVSFGYLISGRDMTVPGIEDAVGPFINMLVCRLDITPQVKLSATLDQLQKDYMSSLPHSTISLGKVQHALHLSGSPLFNTALSFRRLPQEKETTTDIAFKECVPIYDPTEYSVSINVEASENTMLIDLDYWTDHMSPGQATNVGSAFLQALSSIVIQSNDLVDEISLLSPAHQSQLQLWNADIPELLNQSVHGVIQTQAGSQPDASAICAWDANFTFAELETLSGHLAQYLLGLGVGPETFVPTCFDKSAWTIVAMLGVLKAGGAAVPLDATHPKNALELRVKDTGAQVVLVTPSRAHLFQDMDVVIVLVSSEHINRLPASIHERISVSPESPCFVIYTSGSTGKPKGVVLEHRSIVTSAKATGTAYGFGSHSRVLQFAAYTFDNSLAEIFITLMRGGCVCVPSEHDRFNDLAGAMNRLGVNFADLTPTVAGFLQPSDVPGLEGLSLGGEALTKEVIETWINRVSLHCCYGPSECSINSTWNGDLGRSLEATNIGKSIGSISWIADSNNHDLLVPIGSVGELVIEGPILARGYLNDPEKTAKSFITNPKWPMGEQRRIYKTGDLARNNSDGTITYLGRKDCQIKLNGQRIELGEIEHYLKLGLRSDAQSAVELVSIKGTKKASKVLAAFFCIESDGSVPIAGFDDFLLPISEEVKVIAAGLEQRVATSLPAYMVPLLYVPVKALPTTSSGKLDRKRLRSSCDSLPEEQILGYRLATRSTRPPSSQMEQLLAQLWEQNLGLAANTVGLDDSFFRLGGDSVAAIKLISAARLKGITLTVANVFKKPILLELSRESKLHSSTEESYIDATPEPFSLIRNVPSIADLLNEISSHCCIDSKSIQDVYHCTAIQEGLIALSNKDPGAYVAQNVYRLPPDVNISRFKQAWESVVEAEVILRTRIVFTESCGFLQVVVREPISWNHLSNLEELVQQDRHLPSHNGGKLSMYSIIEDIANNYHFIWTAHHSLYDGWCIPLILDRVYACYKDTSSVDRALGAAFPRFIGYLSGIDKNECEAFWKTKLSGATAIPFPALPHPSYQVRATSKCSQTFDLHHEPSTNITLPSSIRAAWALVLSTYSGAADDVVFGEILTGRDVPVSDITNIVGPTLATVPTRVSIDPQLSISRFLENVQEQSAEVIPFQHAGLQRIKQLGEDTATACGFQNLLAINHDDSDTEDQFWDFQSSGTVGTNFYSYPLTISCQIANGKINIDAHYDQEVISTWLIKQILTQFQFTLENFNSHRMRNEKLGEMTLLNPQDESSIREWNNGPLHCLNECIHHLIERAATGQPASKIAVESWDAKLTYPELLNLSSQLAGHLVEKGACGTLIPLCFEKSAWTIVAMVAVLMSGAAMVPLDPSAPISRLQNIVGDTAASLILCSPQNERICTKLVQEVIVVERDMIEALRERVDLPVVGSSSPAYVIFTSGTTGKPKGTIVQHKAFCSGAACHGPALHIDSSSRVLQFASYTFDASLLEILTTLTLGGCVCVPSDERRMNSITDVIAELKVSWTLLTPSFVQTIQPSTVPTLRTLVLGGEAMSQTHLSTWADKLRLFNAYGPSESSVVATVSNQLSLTSDPANIGRAVGNHAWITDISNANRLVPIGAQGELVIDGPILSQGYLNNNEKTAEVFIDVPAWAKRIKSSQTPFPGKLYRTGDIARYGSNGEVIYCGRRDTQTKLHGQRLELAEIEHHVRSDPSVQHAMATVPMKGPCASRLVAIMSLQEFAAPESKRSGLNIVVREASDFYVPAIRERLCDKLSASVMPSNWVILQSLPLLPSGKLDRRRVERWVEDMDSETYHLIANVDIAPEHTTGGTELERQLQWILGAALNLPSEQIGLHQSFLHLGGDSLSAMHVMSKCRSEGLGVSVQDIIQSKSISDLSLRVTLPKVLEEELEVTDQSFGLSPVQRLFFECIRDTATQNHFNQSVLLRVTRRINPEDIASALRTITHAHPMLRARFTKSEAGEWQQSISTSTSSYRFQARKVPPKEITLLCQESQESLSIQNGPVIVADLFDSDEEGQMISIVAHHLVVDVVSWGIILQDLEDILQTGNIRLHSTLSFHRWSNLQLEHARKSMDSSAANLEEAPVADFDYWEMEGESNTYADVIEDGFELDPETSLLLLGICQDSMRTEIVDILLASIMLSFRKVFPGRPTMPTIYNEGHGREPWENSNIDLSRTVGWFTTMCPIFLPSDIEGDIDLLGTIRWVKDLRSRIPQKGRTYFAHRMLTEDGQSRYAKHWPMEITFNYLGKMQQQLERKDALLQPAKNFTASKFDIGGQVPRFALFEISASVENGCLRMSFSYNGHMRRQIKIGRWVTECQKCLRDAAKRLVQMKPERTLSDFPLLPLSYDGISKLTKLLPRLGARSIEEIEDVYPCSPVQQGMLLAQSKNPELYAYSSILEVCSLGTKPVDPHLLAEAWQNVIRRHATLRTVFIDSICQKGLNDQVVLQDTVARTAWLECEDSGVMVEFEKQHPINLVDLQPPHRLSICKTDRNRVFCKIELSHTICDGTSIPILLQDIARAYTLASGELSNHLAQNAFESSSGPKFSQYISHITSNKSPDVDINYWKSYLAGIEPCHLDTLNDGTTAEKKLRTLILPLSSSSNLERFCSKNGFTMSNVLQFIWALVLRSYVGTDEVTFGYLTSGRDVPIQGIQDAAVGTFINMLTCRIDFHNETTVTKALNKIQSDFVAGLGHQSCSLADVQHELHLSSKALFNTAFTFQKRTYDKQETNSCTPDIAFTVIDAEDPNEYDVTVNIEATSSGVELHLGYWTTSLSNAQALNIAKTFERALDETISHQLDHKVGDLDLFSDHSRKQIMHWNSTLPVTVEKCIHHIIHDRKRQRQASPAVCAWDESFTYSQLDNLSTRLAYHLVELGIGPERYVPLCFPKSAWMVVSILAVLKAGGAFCPLDHTHPQGRLKNFIDDVQADLVLCSAESSQKLLGASKRVIVVDMHLIRNLVYTPETFISSEATPDNSAYIIFTSGTTGRPKGTIIEHAAFCTSAIEHSRAMGINSDSRVLQFASHTFDASVMEILTTLMVGGCVCIPNEQDRMNNIPGVVKSMKVTWTLLTPSVASTLFPKSVPSLQVLVTGGEKMTQGHIAKWKEHCSLVNAYGPSETSVIASVGWKVDKHGKVLNTDPSNIGRAVGGRAWIVDPRNYHMLVPAGAIGELAIEGRTVARGYLNNDLKTAETFVSNPTWLQNIESTQRVYRTGDLVRYNSDGTLSYVARKDTQIKLNGQRIELGEIEYNVKTILSEEYLSAVELVAPTSRVSTKSLVVFFTHPDHNSISEEKHGLGAEDILLSMSGTSKQLAKQLDSSLAELLPSYMIPSFYVPITKMPWTSSGKLDRVRLRNTLQSLPMESIEQYRPTESEIQVVTTPASSMQKRLQRLWEGVLMTSDPIGNEDSFFRLGGDSVAAMKLVGLARSEGISLTVIDIFKNPRLFDMAQVCRALVEEEKAQLKPFSLLKSNEPLNEIIEEVSQQCRVDKALVVDVYPCSLLQEGLITLSTKQAGAYVVRNAFKLPKDLDLLQFKRVWDQTVEDLDILRTRIVHMRSSEFVQVVLQHDPIKWNLVESVKEVDDMALPTHNGGLLTRYTIVNGETPGDTYFVWHIHHALYDGWSLPMVLRRVEKAYFNESLPILKSSYSSFIQYLSDVDDNAANDHWRTRLMGASPLQFPQQSKLLSGQTSNTQMLTHTSNISRNTASLGITVATTIRAAWAMVVAAYSGSDDVVFGETMAGRNIAIQGITDIIGPTITTVPTRIQVDRDHSVSQLLYHVQKIAMEVIPYQHVGLQRIKRLGSDPKLACDFQNLLVIQTADENIDSKLWDLQNDDVSSSFFTYPLVLECKSHPDKVEITAHFDGNILSPWQMQRVLYQLDTVLKQLNDLPKLGTNARVDCVEVLSLQDKELVQKWNSDIPRVVDSCIHEDFEDMAVSQPQAQAIHAWDGRFTYQELLDHAKSLAHYLILQHGVSPEVFVALCMDKSVWAVVAVLGIMMAGGAYVPLDPSSPRARHQEMIKDVHAKLVLCSPHHKDGLKGLLDDVVVMDQTLLSTVSNPTATHDLHRARSCNAAYAIFTSGSTGRPKGTVVEHRAISTSSAAMRKHLLMSPNARVFQFASFTFDVSVLEMLTTLTCGGCICIPSEEMRTSNVGGAIDSLGATWAFLTPSVANLIDPECVPSLKVLVCGGEAMSNENVERWASRVTLVNGYGPTEASVIAISNCRVSEDRDPINIGFPLPSGRAWIADAHDHNLLAPVGCIGELLLSGPLLAREYINNPLQTEQSFIEHPSWADTIDRLSPNPHTNSSYISLPYRMYKTGDLVRYHEDGSLVFIGRKDHQVKLYGQRMELGEIENLLDLDPEIQHAVVALPKTGPFRKRLVVVVSLAALTSSDITTTTCELVLDGPRAMTGRTRISNARNRLSDHLPPYMVPSSWLLVESIPIRSSGKLDHPYVERWLQNIDDATYEMILQVDEQDEDATPATETAKLVQQIISRVLNLPIARVPLSKSFLSLGGDSITSMQVMAHCRKEKINFSLTDVLKSKSIHQLASVARYEDHVELQDEEQDMDFDLSPVQQMYFQSQAAASFHGKARFNQSFSLQITRPVESHHLRSAVQKIIEQHSLLRARFRKNGEGVWQQRVGQGDVSASCRVHLLQHETDIPAMVEDSQSSLNIQEGPLFIADLFNIVGGKQMVFMVAHHLVIDMVSWRIIIQDLEEVLNTGSLNSEKPLSFLVWCSMQQDHTRKLAVDGFDASLPFKVPSLDIDYWGLSRIENSYQTVTCETFLIDTDITALALGECNDALRTEPIELFLAAIAHSFRRVFTDRDTPAIFNETHGREPWDTSIDISRTVGWFTSLFPLHVPIDIEKDDPVETVRRMKDTRRSIPDNGRPNFAHRFLAPEGNATENNQCQPMEILFNYLGRMQQLEHEDSLLQQWDYPNDENTSTMIADVGPHTTRLALFEISAAVVREKVQFTFLYNSETRNRQGVQRWVTECRETFEEIVKSLASTSKEPSYTLSDFPLLPMTYDGLHKMMTKSLPQVGITLDSVEDIYPCAPLQDGLLISQLKNPSLYHINAIFEVCPPPGDSPVNTNRLVRAWQKVLDRHAALRTVFVDSVCRGDIFNQVVVKGVESGIITIFGEESDAIKRLNSTSILDGNYTKQPRLPHQASIYETSSEKVYFKLEVNHAIIDGTSANILLHDLALAYHGRLEDGPGPLYSDYIAYIKRYASSDSIDFWKGYLEGATICNFPVQVKSAPKERALESITMKFHRFSALQELGKKMNVTLANIMSAAWAFCLRQYTQSDDICFGYLTSGRDVPVKGVQTALGAFINILVCRVKFEKQASLKEVFQMVQNDFLRSLDHQHVSLAQVQHDLMSGEALFNTAISIQSDAPSNGEEENYISFKSLLAHDPSEYPVTVNIRTQRGQEGVVIRYWNDIMSAEQGQELEGILKQVMEMFIDKPHQLVEDLDLSPCQTSQPQELLPETATTSLPPQVTMSEAQLRTIISDCVREVLGQMLISGGFPDISQTGNNNDPINIVQEQTIHSMMDYAQSSLPSPPGLVKDPMKTIPEQSAHSTVDYAQSTIPSPRPQLTKTPSANTIASIRLLSPVEQKLLSVWSELLQISKESIKKNDSFFKLGGDSIVAMQMVGMARDEDLALTVANIFKHPTFRDMADVIRLAEEGQSPAAISIARDGQSPASIAAARDYLEAHNSRSQAIRNAFYQRYSLLDAQDVDAFLQQNICPKVYSFRGGIIDVFPVTDFQALAVTGTLMESRWMLNYFYLEGDGTLSLKILKAAISRTVNAFDILRTVFTAYENRFFQVVLRKLQPSFSVHETEDLANFTLALQQKDREEGPRLGESYLQFKVARQKDTNRHRIIMRLSHAQYDGVCLPSILSALQSGYDGHGIPETPAFSEYVRDAARQTTDEHYLYWKNFLRGSSMTDVIRRRGPNYSRGTDAPTTLKRIVRMTSLASESITPATIIKAAWSLVLAQWSAQSDIVFGNVISGRNADVLGVDRIIGPCVNLIPVRIEFQDSWTVLDLLRSIQDQQVAAMPYESLGFREIIKHCTPWPDWTNFSTVCQHQNIQRQSHIQLGDNEYTLGAIGSQEDFADVTILSTPQQDNEIEISLIFTSNSGITLALAEDMFESLCETAIRLPDDLPAVLPTPDELSMLPRRTLEEDPTATKRDVSLDIRELTREELSSYFATLTQAWRQILPEKISQSGTIALDASFFELGGDIIGLAQVGSLLEQGGVKLRVEDLVDHPKMDEQIGLMAMQVRKEKEKEGLEAEEVDVPVVETNQASKKGLRGILEKSVKLAKKVRRRRVGEEVQE